MTEFEEPSANHLLVLETYFGHSEFKKEQWAMIKGLMYDKRDCCVIASTGFGKSLIYQFPAVYMNKLTIVISPLIALMQDQVNSLKKKGIKTCFFGSQQTDKSLNMQDHTVVYMCPEYFIRGRGYWQVKQAQSKILLFAIDEAHVLDQWRDFRKEYKELGKIRDVYPSIPIVALTASAPQYVQDYFTTALKMRNFLIVKTALDRPNLEYSIQRKRSFIDQVFPLLKSLTEGSAIVYCISRNECDETVDFLNKLGLKCKAYHSTISREKRTEVLEEFLNNKLRVVVCTIAFGLGVDKPDVRLVVHYGISKTIEAYYQESGRAGRDGKPSQCKMFYSQDDYQLIQHLINNNRTTNTGDEVKQQHALLDRMMKFINSKQCRRNEMLDYLGTSDNELKKLVIRENCCDNCKLDMMHNIPLKLQYCDVIEAGTTDVTESARLALSAVGGQLTRVAIINHLKGDTLPTRDCFRWCKLEHFGKGKAYTTEWCNSIFSLLTQRQYLRLSGNVLCLEPKAKKFLRFKGEKLMFPPTHGMLQSMKKRKNVEFYRHNGEIKSRPKDDKHRHENDEMFPVVDDFDMNLEACAAEIEAKHSNSFQGDHSTIKDAPDNQTYSTQYHNKPSTSKATQSANDQKEVESLQNLSFDEDSLGLEESSQKRKLEGCDDESSKNLKKVFRKVLENDVK